MFHTLLARRPTSKPSPTPPRQSRQSTVGECSWHSRGRGRFRIGDFDVLASSVPWPCRIFTGELTEKSGLRCSCTVTLLNRISSVNTICDPCLQYFGAGWIVYVRTRPVALSSRGVPDRAPRRDELCDDRLHAWRRALCGDAGLDH